MIGVMTPQERANAAFDLEDRLWAIAKHPLDAVIIGALILADTMLKVTKSTEEAISLIQDAMRALRDRIRQGVA